MKSPRSLLPDNQTLAERLTAALTTDFPGPVEVLRRELPRFMSTFPNEIVTCRLPTGRKRRVFIKYQANCGHPSFGHRGDVAYEAEVYRRLLSSLPDFRPRYLGAHTAASNGDAWLILEYVYRASRVSDLAFHGSTDQPNALFEAARWLARFHDHHKVRVREPELSFLKHYDPNYYRGWAERAFEFTAPLRGRFPWLAALDRWGDEWFTPLLSSPTIIHGEFYSKTILARDQKLFMVDWESAAVAPGEIDLASLTEGKHRDPQVWRRCQQEYQRLRWPDGTPANFARRFDAAKIYLHCRWLGDRPEWALREKSLWRYDDLCATAKRMGLL